MESRDARINDIWEQYELTPGSAREMKREEYQEMNQLKKAVLDLKNEIRSLGSVNVNAIEEFKEISERHEFLKSPARRSGGERRSSPVSIIDRPGCRHAPPV